MKSHHRFVANRILLFCLSVSIPCIGLTAPLFNAIELGPLNGQFNTFANSISADGVVVGTSESLTDNIGRALIFNSGGQVIIPTLGGSSNAALDINKYGMAVGASHLLGDQVLHAFRYDGSASIDLGTLGGPTSIANSINSEGQIVGWSYTQPGQYSNPHAFLWENGVMHDLWTRTGGLLSIANDINNNGIVIGTNISNLDGQEKGYIVDGASAFEIAGLFGNPGIPLALNNHASVVGYSTLNSGFRQGFLFKDGVASAIGSLGGNETLPAAINDRGSIVGSADVDAENSHAFLFQNGVMHDLNTVTRNLGDWTLVSASGINERNQISALAMKDGEFRAFQLSPMQKVSLEFGQTVPFEVVAYHIERINKTFYVSVDEGGTMSAATISSDDQQAILAGMRKIFADSGINNLDISIGNPDPDVTRIYFSDKNTPLAGYALNGPDKFNLRADDTVVVFRLDAQTDSETAVHELGHALGLRHVNPGIVTDPNTGEQFFEIMSSSTDKPSGTSFRFLNRVSSIDDITSVFGDHNPEFHLRHYIDGETTLDLLADGIEPGSWDEDSNVKYLFRLSLSSSARILFDVDVVGSSGEVGRLLAHFDSISLEALMEHDFLLEDGEALSLFASSVEGGAKDIVLASGDPIDHENLFHSPGGPVSTQLLLLEEGGNSTIASATVTVLPVPEPTATVFLLISGVWVVMSRRSRVPSMPVI